MNRHLLVLAPLALLAGCVVHSTPRPPTYVEPAPAYQPPPAYEPPPPAYVPPPAAPLRISYFGQHFVPEEYGGGWCYVDGPHVHDYMPDRDDWYVYDAGHWYYRGPFEFAFIGSLLVPEGRPRGGGRSGRLDHSAVERKRTTS
jgi:hypothetical protein